MLALWKISATVASLIAVIMAGPLWGQEMGCKASIFVLQNLEKEPVILSPDGKYSVVVGVKSEEDSHGWLMVRRGEKLLASYDTWNLSGGIFVKWAPDSGAFYFMWSDGGALGGYHVRAFRLKDAAVIEVPLTRFAETDFEQRYPCPSRGHNVVSIKWIQGSMQMLLGLQVYPTSDCGMNMGRYRGYVVETDSGIVKAQYSEVSLKKLWPTDCPTDIWPSGLWGTEELEKAQRKAIEKKSE
jgi:hypothetical protein